MSGGKQINCAFSDKEKLSQNEIKQQKLRNQPLT